MHIFSLLDILRGMFNWIMSMFFISGCIIDCIWNKYD